MTEPRSPTSGLTVEQAYWVRGRIAEWLRIRERWERESGPDGQVQNVIAHDGQPAHKRDGPMRWQPERPRPTLNQLAADADHSALLVRLLIGKEPLPEPPPLRHAYPVYPDD